MFCSNGVSPGSFIFNNQNKNRIIIKSLRIVIRVAQFNFIPFSPLLFRGYAFILASKSYQPDAPSRCNNRPSQSGRYHNKAARPTWQQNIPRWLKTGVRQNCGGIAYREPEASGRVAQKAGGLHCIFAVSFLLILYNASVKVQQGDVCYDVTVAFANGLAVVLWILIGALVYESGVFFCFVSLPGFGLF